MQQIGVFFGTDSGTTRLIAKRIARALARRVGEASVARPMNVNRAEPGDLARHPVLLLGTPSYAKGALPGRASRNAAEGWLEFLPRLADLDLSAVRVALFGLGDQEQYPDHFVDAMADLHAFFAARGARMLGAWPTAGYEFAHSRAVVDGRFVGLALDQHLQHLQTDARIESWLDLIVPSLGLAPANDAGSDRTATVSLAGEAR